MRPGFTPAEDIQRFRPRHVAQRDGDARSPRSPGGRSLADLVRMNESQGSGSPSQARRTVRAPKGSMARADQVSTWKKVVPAESRSGQETNEGRVRNERLASARASPKPTEQPRVSARPATKPAITTEPKLVPDTQPSKASAATSKRTQGVASVPTHEHPVEKAALSPKGNKTAGDTQAAGDTKLTDDVKASGDASKTVSPPRSDDAVDALQASMDNLSIERR